jgi:hypothetical protein
LDSWSPAAPGELSTQSEEFRTRSASHNVRLHQTGAKHVHHPVVGDLSLTFEMLELRADPGVTILTYTAEPGSKSEEALNLLGELGTDARSGGAVKGDGRSLIRAAALCSRLRRPRDRPNEVVPRLATS